MRLFAWAMAIAVGFAGASTAPLAAASPARWSLPKGADVYLMENDLIYARFLALARNGTYRQINRDERGSREVDHGVWEQDAAGGLQLRGSCRALRPRAVKCGPLYVIIVEQAQIDGLPRLLESLRSFLTRYADAVFDAGSIPELRVANGPAIYLELGHGTFDRTDVVNLAATIADACERERSGTYVLKPVRNTDASVFALPGGAFGEEELPGVRQTAGTSAVASLPFYFSRIDAASYAREIGRWQPLHLPGNLE